MPVQNGPVRPASTAPRLRGLPLLGNAIQASNDACRFFVRCHRELGPVFRVTYPGRALTFMAGLEANAFFANEGARVFSAKRTYGRVSRELGTETYPNAHDGAAHNVLRQVLAPSLSALAIEPFLPRVIEMVRERARSWTPGSVSRLSDAVSPLVSDIVSVCTTGRPMGERLARDGVFYGTMMGVVGVGCVLPEFTLYLPPVRAARDRLAKMMNEALEEHRREGPGIHREPDVLDALLSAARAKPDLIDEKALRAFVMLPMKNAGIYLYRLVSFVLYELLSREELLAKVVAEADETLARGAPGLEDLRQMRTLDNVILEALRVYPMAIALPRVVSTPYDFGGFHFAEGDTVYIAGPVTHFDPAYFPDPDAFDPARYTPARSEHKRPHVYAPFGLGAHACLARGYSQTLASVIVAALVREVRLELEPKGFKISMSAVPCPIPEAKLRFRMVERRAPMEAPAAAAPAQRTGRRWPVQAESPELEHDVKEGLALALGELTAEQRKAVFDDVKQEVFLAGHVVFRQGDPADRFYLVRRGELEVFHEDQGRESRVIARVSSGGHFGEIGILQGVARTATVRATARTTALSLGRESFNALVGEGGLTRGELLQLMERRAMVSTLSRALPHLDPGALGRLAGRYEERAYEEGAAIVVQGDEADRFFILTKGRVEVVVRPPQGSEFVVAELEAIDCFGEVGILQGRPRTATVRAAHGPVTVVEIPRELFVGLVADNAGTREDLGRVAGERLAALALAADES